MGLTKFLVHLLSQITDISNHRYCSVDLGTSKSIRKALPLTKSIQMYCRVVWMAQ